MLTQYLNLTSQLLQNPPAPSALYSTSQLTNWINIARGQIAGEGKCVRAFGTVTTSAGQRNYNFSVIDFGLVTTTGIQGAIAIRRIQYNVGLGQKWIKGKAWEWFDFHRLNNPVPVPGVPTEWAQYAQGSAGQGSITGVGSGAIGSGSFYIDPPPDVSYTLNCDCECYPQALTTDSSVEAIPYLWTDAVPYFAAYQALMSSQTTTRLEYAQRIFQLYRMFVQRARGASNPDVNNFAFAQSADPTMMGRLGITSKEAQQNAQ